MTQWRVVTAVLLGLVATAPEASFHTWQVNKLYSNADGSVQFIELQEGFGLGGQQFLMGLTITSQQGTTTRTFVFPANLPDGNTAGKSFLVATPGFAALGIVIPDYIVPPGFLFTSGSTVNFAGVDSVTYAALPVDGLLSLSRSGGTATNSPRNYAGQTGSVIPVAPPVAASPNEIPVLDNLAILLLASFVLAAGLAGRRRLRDRG